MSKVEHGIALLNTIHGKNWTKRINRKRMDIGDLSSCIVAQLHGDYFEGLRELSAVTGKDISGVDYGFTLNLPADESEWKALNTEWKRVLALLQEEQTNA